MTMRGPRRDSILCCNNVDVGTVSEFGRAVESGSVTELGVCSVGLGRSRVGEMVFRLLPVGLGI